MSTANSMPIYPPHSQPPPLEIHGHQQHQLPAISQQQAYGHHPASQHPNMNLPPLPQGHHDQYAQHAPQDQLQTPTTPAQESKPAPTAEQQAMTQKALQPVIGKSTGRTFKLDVVQQPKRARMCGFGDKDRRPITPPPCVRLIVTDEGTGKEVDCNEIEHSMYVLNVDLWSEDALKEVNLVRHTTTTPSISSTTPASFESMEQSTPAFANILPSSSRDGPYGASQHQVFAHPHVTPYAAQGPYGQVGYMSTNGYQPPNQFYSPQNEYRTDLHPAMPQLASQVPGMQYAPPRMFGGPQDGLMPQRIAMPGAQPVGMFTRNLIGSLSASAFRLTDPNDKIGIWFILQDMSVRTEGQFRLRYSFVNVAALQPNQAVNPASQSAPVNTGSCPVLASCFSDVFTVYSAKKFPGVCESTALSKCFATQGIKIPIRKEGAGNSKGNAGDDDDYE